MNKIYIVGTVVKFTYKELSFFKKNERKEGKIIRKVRFLYAESELAAKDKYLENFFVKCDTFDEAFNESTTCEGFDHYELFWHSNNYDVEIYENKIKLLACNTKQTIDDYKKFMLPEDFRNWWWDGYEQKTKEKGEL